MRTGTAASSCRLLWHGEECLSPSITQEEYERRSRVWFADGRAYDHLPKRARDRWIVLHALADAIPGAGTLSEREVNQRIQGWLEGPGKSFFVDHVALRRELVDWGFLDRDAAGLEYSRSRRYQRRQAFEADRLASPDAPGASRPPSPYLTGLLVQLLEFQSDLFPPLGLGCDLRLE